MDLLTGTGRGGLFADGYLAGEPLVSYFDDGETPFFVFGSSKRGVTRTRDGTTDRVDPGSGYRSITAVTDRRIQFVVGDARETDDWAKDVHLADVESVSVESGLMRERLSITGADGTTWSVHLRDVDAERVETFIEAVSWVWIQVERLLDDARKRLVDASQHEKSREYEQAKDALSTVRKTLDEGDALTDDLAAEAGSGIRERIEQVERRYRETKRRIHTSRGTHLVDEAERYWRDDEFERAYEQFVQARSEYGDVLDIRGLRPDKTDAMRKRIKRVDENLQHLSRAPLDRANQERKQALTADDPREALDHWESAHRLYRRVIELDWGRDQKRFEGDVDVIRDRVVESVDEILSVRRTIADVHRDRSRQLLADGKSDEARRAYAEAMDALKAAVQLAREFDPDAVGDLRDRLDELDARIQDATSTVSEEKTTDQGPMDASDDTVSQPSENSDSAESRDREDDTTYGDFDNWVTLADDP
ncbi:MAG: hypothetical protein V5A52_04435 [Halovenus sp.]